MALNLLPNNPMTFTENQHGTAVLEKLRSQRELVRCCDVILHVANKQFQAHRCVLAACSPYFDSIFKASKTVKEQLNISSQDPEVFQCLLTYMYTGTVVVDKTNVAELLRLANKLLIAKLKEHCAEYLERYLDATNCLTVRDMATKFNLESLEKTTGTFISTHLSHVIEGEEVLEFSHTHLEDFLRCPSWELDEDQTLLLVTRWVHHNPKNRERNLRSLLTWVQWSHFNPQTAITLVQTHPLYSGSSSLLALFFLLDALNDNQILPTDFLALFYKLKANFCQASDSVVDNESFLSLAISTAIDGLQEDQLTIGRPPESSLANTDFSSHMPLPPHQPQLQSDTEEDQNKLEAENHPKAKDFHLTSRRGCEEHELEQCPQYELCHPAPVAGHGEDVHGNQQGIIFSHPQAAPPIINTHTHISEDSLGETTSTEDINFLNNTQSHFGPAHTRPITLWHQEPQYTNEESLSSDSSHAYQRQVYEHGFSLKVSDSYNTRVNPSLIYSNRESPVKGKQTFQNAMSYYVSTYNPEDDMMVSDDQSAQSFQYDDSMNPSLSCYPCRLPEDKENQHLILESHHNQENYVKSYYQDDSTNTQDMGCSQRDVYYNENSSDTQISNCPQDMTVQHQFPQSQQVKRDPEDKGMEEDLTNTSLPGRFTCDEQHYDHYLDSITEDHHSLARPNEDTVLAVRSRDTKEEMLDKKHIMPECIINPRNIMVEEKRDEVYKGCVGEGRNFFVEKGPNEERRNQEGDLAEGITPESLHPLTALDVDATPRHVKFKINRTINAPTIVDLSGTSVGGDLGPGHSSPEDMRLISKIEATTVVVPHFEDNSFNPDDPEEVIQAEEMEEPDLLKEIGESKETPEEKKEINRRTSTRIKPNGKSEELDQPTATGRVCELCQAVFVHNKDYFAHMRDHFPGPPHRCDTCDSTFKRIYHLLDHRLIHLDVKTHKCPHCSFSSHKKFNLTEHMMRHAQTRKYKCKVCGDQFTRLQILKVHETKHTDERPFLCETCGWSGKTKNALIIHTKLHTGELLRCQFENCNYSTPKKSHLKEHMQHHSKSRPFVCDVCGRSFITNSHLRRHNKLHLPEKPFKCPQCDYCSPRQDRLKVHVKKKHTQKQTVKIQPRKKQAKKKVYSIPLAEEQTEETQKEVPSINCHQADFFSDLENTNVSLQPQLPSTPPPTTLSEYPPSPSYTYQPQSAPDDPLIIVPDMSIVTEGFTPLPQSSPHHRNLGSTITYDGSYHSPQYQASPSHFEPLSPSQTSLSYANGHHQEESPLNFAAYMKYD